jgi:hypothetical protein
MDSQPAIYCVPGSLGHGPHHTSGPTDARPSCRNSEGGVSRPFRGAWCAVRHAEKCARLEDAQGNPTKRARPRRLWPPLLRRVVHCDLKSQADVSVRCASSLAKSTNTASGSCGLWRSSTAGCTDSGPSTNSIRRCETLCAASTTTGSSGGSNTERPQRTDASSSGRPREHRLQRVSETGCGTDAVKHQIGVKTKREPDQPRIGMANAEAEDIIKLSTESRQAQHHCGVDLLSFVQMS